MARPANPTGTWMGDLTFRVDYPAGETLTLASVEAAARPGPGPSPMEALLGAIAGCTGMDVVAILRKMRKEPAALRIEIAADRRQEVPRVYTRVHLRYTIEGPGIDAAAAKRAVALSQETYCSVAAMLRPNVPMDYEVILNGERVE